MNLTKTEVSVGDKVYNRETMYFITKIIPEGTKFTIAEKETDRLKLSNPDFGIFWINIQYDGIHFTTSKP